MIPLSPHIAAGQYKCLSSGLEAIDATLCTEVHDNALASICHSGSLLLPECHWTCSKWPSDIRSVEHKTDRRSCKAFRHIRPMVLTLDR